MRCSLLLLSTYLDGELNQSRTAELDAHLIGCNRCQAGLGYLREEAHRINGLARVTIPDHSAHAMLTQVGLIDEFDMLPGAPAAAPRRVDDQDAAPWFGQGVGKALPWAPRVPEPGTPPVPGAAPASLAPAVPQPAAPGDLADVEVAGARIVTDARPPATRPVQTEIATPPAAVAPVSHVPPQEMPTRAPDVAPPHETPAPHDFATRAAPPGDTEFPRPVIPQRVPQPSGPRFIQRLRDAVTVRWALMRGVQTADDDSVEIVSGSGAGEWSESARQRVQRERAAQRATSGAPQFSAATKTWEQATPVAAPEAQPPEIDISAAPTQHQKAEPAAPVWEDPTTAWDADAPMWDTPVPAQTSQTPQTPRPTPAPTSPSRPGRHARIVTTGTGFSLKGLLKPKPAPTGTRLAAPRVMAGGTPWSDPRLWALGGGVLLLLIIGLLTGKHVAPVSTVAQQPIASAQPSAHAHPSVAPVIPSVAPSVAPTPSPLQLTGTRTFGSGARNFEVSNIRYGLHPNDFRMVFDMAPVSGAPGTGSPTVTAGFGNATTFYVIFAGVLPGGSTGNLPPGALATGIHIVQPSPIAGHLVYEFTLSRAATVSGYYLAGPTRLVLDLAG